MSSAKRTLRNQGFTLVELLIVIAIIAILVTIVVIAINPVRRIQHAQNVVRLNDLANIARVVEVYNVDNGTYPTEHYYDTSRGCTTTDPGGNWWEDSRFINNEWSGGDCPAMETLDYQVIPNILPKDPINRDFFLYGYNAVKKGGDAYVGYSLETFLEGRGPYRKCFGDWKNTWMDSPFFCGITNPEP